MVASKSDPTKDKLLKLMAEKQNLEIQINVYGNTLTSNDNVGMQGPLVDSEGFPRNDIDIYKVRQARQQIICLQNNHKVLMKVIEKLLHDLHAEAKTEEQLTQQTNEMQLNAVDTTDDSEEVEMANIVLEPLKPILRIIHVEAGSPAEKAGLRSQDEIAEFGSVNANNFNKELSTIANIVRHMCNNMIPLKVIRCSEILNITLIPSGNGLLGCKIVLVE